MTPLHKKIHEIEKKNNIKLIYNKHDFKIKKCREFIKPFKKGDMIKAKLVFAGRLNNEMLAVADNRLISVPNCHKSEGTVKLKIRRIKHNIFLGELV